MFLAVVPGLVFRLGDLQHHIEHCAISMPTLKAVSNLFAIHNVIGKGGFAVVLLASRTPKKDAPPVQVCRGVVYGRGEVQGDGVLSRQYWLASGGAVCVCGGGCALRCRAPRPAML